MYKKSENNVDPDQLASYQKLACTSKVENSVDPDQLASFHGFFSEAS